MSKVARRIINIINPFEEKLTIAVVKKPKGEFNLTYEWLENEIPAQSQIEMELVWSPQKVVGTREVFEIADQFGNKKAISVILKSVELKKLAPRKTGLAKTLRLKVPSPPRSSIRHMVMTKTTNTENYSIDNTRTSRAISPTKKLPMTSASALKSPLRCTTNFQVLQDENDGRNVTPKNASLLFDNIKFTPLTETKPKCESKLEYLSSLPTPSTVTRDDIFFSKRTERVIEARGIQFSPEVAESTRISMQTPAVITRETFEGVSCETPVRKVPITTTVRLLASKLIEEEAEEFDDLSTNTYIKGPCEINEIEIVIKNDSMKSEIPVSTTFKINKSKSFIENDFECQHSARGFSESMREENGSDKVQLAIQGSMPNLCDISTKPMPIDYNRYYMGSHNNQTGK